MLQEIADVRERAEADLRAAASVDDLDAWHHRFLSRKGEVKQLLRSIGKLGDPDEKKRVGREVNELHRALEEHLEARREEVVRAERERRFAEEEVDITLPGTRVPPGRLHPVHRTLREVCRIFRDMGFQVFESPHVETDEFNFQYLNFPPHHPAREMQDTFFLPGDLLLRTHTSPGQIHAMRACAPEPLRAILPGICYRNETITPRSEIQFHQVEALAVGPDIGLADLKGVILEFVHQLFGPERRIVLRGSYFPFTEPSVEVDVDCILCAGEGCRLCKSTGWLEIMGAGVVHPHVLRSGGYDPERFRGFALGLGVERIVLLRHAIDDIRYFLSGDLRFLEQF